MDTYFLSLGILVLMIILQTRTTSIKTYVGPLALVTANSNGTFHLTGYLEAKLSKLIASANTPWDISSKVVLATRIYAHVVTKQLTFKLVYGIAPRMPGYNTFEATQTLNQNGRCWTLATIRRYTRYLGYNHWRLYYICNSWWRSNGWNEWWQRWNNVTSRWLLIVPFQSNNNTQY